MRKSRTIGSFLTLALAIVAGSAMGQNPASIKTDYTPIESDAVLNNSSFITVGEKTGFYVLPDAAYHVGYNAATNTGMVTGTKWSWTIPTGLTATAGYGVAVTGATDDKANFVELTGTTVGVYTVNVKEQAAGVVCSDGGKDFLVHVFPAPTFAFGTGIGFAAATCTSGDQTITINLTGVDNPAAKWSLNVYEGTVNAAGTDFVIGDEITADAKTFDFTKAGGTQTLNGKDWILAAGTAYVAATPANGTFTLTGTYPINYAGTKALTIYRFSVKDDGTQGVNDFVSRKTSPAKYYAAAATVDFVVKKAPVTGPVYHISNNVAM